MTTAGWLVLIPSVGGVVLFIVWCVWKVLSTADETSKIHGFELNSRDAAKKEARK